MIFAIYDFCYICARCECDSGRVSIKVVLWLTEINIIFSRIRRTIDVLAACPSPWHCSTYIFLLHAFSKVGKFHWIHLFIFFICLFICRKTAMKQYMFLSSRSNLVLCNVKRIVQEPIFTTIALLVFSYLFSVSKNCRGFLVRMLRNMSITTPDIISIVMIMYWN